MESPLIVNEESLKGEEPQRKSSYLRISLICACLVLLCVGGYALGGPTSSTTTTALNGETEYDEINHAPNAQDPPRYLSAGAVAALVPGSVVAGPNPFVFIGLGDWGRCGSPTNNPVTRATRCTVQRRMVPSMETWAASLKNLYPNLIVVSAGDNFYDGPMPVSGNRDSIPLPPSAADLLAADNDPIWDMSFRHIYNTPTLRTTPFYNFQGNHDFVSRL